MHEPPFIVVILKAVQTHLQLNIMTPVLNQSWQYGVGADSSTARPPGLFWWRELADDDASRTSSIRKGIFTAVDFKRLVE